MESNNEDFVDSAIDWNYDSESLDSESTRGSNHSNDRDDKKSVDSVKDAVKKCDDDSKSVVPYHHNLAERNPSETFTNWIVDVCLGRRNSMRKYVLKDHHLNQLESAVSRKALPEITKIISDSRGPIPGSIVLTALTDGQPNIAELLLESKRVNPNETDPLLLYIAQQPKMHLWEGELRVARLLKADVNVIGERGDTPVYAAVRNGNVALARFLLEDQEADLQPHPRVVGTAESMLYYAVRGNNSEKMVELLSTYLNLGMICQSDHTNALHWLTASEYEPFGDRVQVAKVLLEHGAFLQQQNSSGLSPLHQAVKINNTELVSLFLDHGADVNQESWINGKFPLYFTAKLNDPSAMINLLMERGANIHKTTYTGATVLHKACEMYNEEAIRSLLKNGANLNLIDENDYTPLAVMLYNDYDESNFDAFKAVIEEIAKLELKNQQVNQDDLLAINEIQELQDYFDEHMEKLTGKKTTCWGKIRRRFVSTNNMISNLLYTRYDYSRQAHVPNFKGILMFFELTVILIAIYLVLVLILRPVW